MRKILNYFYIYTLVLIILIVIGVFFQNIYEVLILIWLPGFPLYILVYNLYKKYKNNPWPIENKVSKISLVSIVLSILNIILIPTGLNIFLMLPAFIYCLFSLTYSIITKRSKSTVVSGVGLLLFIIGVLLFSLILDQP